LKTTTFTEVRYPHAVNSAGAFGLRGVRGEPVMWVSQFSPTKREIGTVREVDGEWELRLAGDVFLPTYTRIALEVAARRRYDRSAVL